MRRLYDHYIDGCEWLWRQIKRPFQAHPRLLWGSVCALLFVLIILRFVQVYR